MKKLSLLSYSIIVFANAVNCQVTKGNWMLGGNINFASTNYKSANYSNSTTYNFQISPNIGYFIIDKLGTGLKTSINLTGSKGIGTDVYSKYNNFNFGPFLRYYFLPVDNRVNILAEGVYQYGVEGSRGGSTPKNTISFSTGAVAFFNSSVGIEFLISYNTYKFNGIDGSNGTIQLGLGLQVHLEK